MVSERGNDRGRLATNEKETVKGSPRQEKVCVARKQYCRRGRGELIDNASNVTRIWGSRPFSLLRLGGGWRGSGEGKFRFGRSSFKKESVLYWPLYRGPKE